MRNTEAVKRAKHQGSFAAYKELQRLKLGLDQAVDIFGIVERAGLWLLFQPLDNALGAYLSSPAGAGVLINTKRPRSVQRLTAAHEYGHHVMRHGASIDGQREIEIVNDRLSLKEIEAQSFALDFLMPAELVNRTWNLLSLPPSSSEVTAQHVYLLSLYLGTSYKATVFQLTTLQRLLSEQAKQMLEIPPKQLKQRLASGIGPANPWADIWPLDENDHGRLIYPAVEDEIRIALPETPSTGYIWTASLRGAIGNDTQTHAPKSLVQHTEDEISDRESSVVDVLSSEYERSGQPDQRDVIATSGHRYIGLRATKPGTCELALLLRRPWEMPEHAARTFEIRIVVEPRPTGEAERGPRQQLQLALAADN